MMVRALETLYSKIDLLLLQYISLVRRILPFYSTDERLSSNSGCLTTQRSWWRFTPLLMPSHGRNFYEK